MIRLALLILLALTSAASAARQVFTNSSFTSWPHGSPVRGTFGPGSETAAHWVSKYRHDPDSRLTVSHVSGGMRYSMQPAPGVKWGAIKDLGETFYLRQTYPALKASLGHRFAAQIVVQSRGGHPWGGFYVNARWNNQQRIQVYNHERAYVLSQAKTAYTIYFTVPKYAGVHWAVKGSQGIETTFLFTTPRNAIVDVSSFRMWMK